LSSGDVIYRAPLIAILEAASVRRRRHIGPVTARGQPPHRPALLESRPTGVHPRVEGPGEFGKWHIRGSNGPHTR
jgi:hypothetical protein